MHNNRLNKQKLSLLAIGLKCIQYQKISNNKSLQTQIEQYFASQQNIDFNKILSKVQKTNLKEIYLISNYYYFFIGERSSKVILNIIKDYIYSIRENVPFSSITYNYLRKFYFCYKQHYQYSNKTKNISISAINKVALVNLYLIYKTLTKGDIYSSYKYLTLRD